MGVTGYVIVGFIVVTFICIVVSLLDINAIRNANKGIYYDLIVSSNYYSTKSVELLNQWLDAHPKSKEIYKTIRGGNFDEKNIKEKGNRLIELGANLVILSISAGYHYFVITNEMVIAGEGLRNEIFVGESRKLVLDLIKVDYAPVAAAVTAPVKEKSVVKSAVAGGVIAGGVGAVVGAAAAVNHNNHAAGKTSTTYFSVGTKREGVYYHYNLVPDHLSYRFYLEQGYGQERDAQYGIYVADPSIDVANKPLDALIAAFLNKN